jgi:hypothetical protein
MGLADKLKGRKACPVCKGPVDTVLVRDAMLCRTCDNYIEMVDGVLERIPNDRVAQGHVFGAPTPWTDLRAVTFPSVIAPLPVLLTEMALEKKAGVRPLDAQWPAACCVCGGAAVRYERLARVVIIPREWGILNIGTQRITLVADGIPHCAEHSGGAMFDRVAFAVSAGDTAFGLVFRSLCYRSKFRKLNPWPWRGLPPV